MCLWCVAPCAVPFAGQRVLLPVAASQNSDFVSASREVVSAALRDIQFKRGGLQVRLTRTVVPVMSRFVSPHYSRLSDRYCRIESLPLLAHVPPLPATPRHTPHPAVPHHTTPPTHHQQHMNTLHKPHAHTCTQAFTVRGLVFQWPDAKRVRDRVHAPTPLAAHHTQPRSAPRPPRITGPPRSTGSAVPCLTTPLAVPRPS